MPYTNPDGTSKYINNFGINSGGFLVAVSTGAMTDVYAQDLTLLGNGAKFSNCTVSSGGVLSMGSGTTLSNTTMYAGGSMAALATAKLLDCRISGGKVTVAENNYIVSGGTIYSGAEIVGLQSAQYTGVTVKSGGKLTNGNNTFFTNVTFESGATIAYGGAPRFFGSENNIAKGTLGNHQTAYTSGGALYDLTTIGATHFSNIVVSNLDVAGNHYLYASRGTVLRDVALNNGNNAAAPMLFPGVYAYNVSAVNANAVLQIHYGKEAASAVTLAGDRTTVNKGGIRYFDESYNKYRVDPDIFIKDGVISGMTLKYGGNTSTTWHLTNLRLAEGIKAQSPAISSGGALFISSGVSILDARVYDSGRITASSSTLISGGTVYSGGEIGGGENYVSYTNVTVESGGKLTNGNHTFFTNVTFESGATIAYGGAPRFFGSENNIAKGTLGNHPTAYTSGGVLYDLNTIGATHFSNIVVSNLNVAGNHYLYASRGTVLRDVALNNGNNAAAPMLFPGVYAYNVSAVNANAVLQIHYGKEAASAVTLAGDRTTVNKGGIRYFDEAYDKYRVDPDIFIKDGVISGMTLKYGGNTSTTWHLTNLRLAEGIKAQSPEISAGGALFVSSGATVLAPTVSSGGVISAFNGALISGGTFSGTSATTDANLMLHLGSGAEARSVTLNGAFVSATGAVVSGAAVHAGARILAYSGTVISDCVFSGSNGSAQTVRLLHISSGAVARKITLSGALAYASQGGAVDGALVASGGHLWCFDAVDKVGTERPIISCTGVTVQANGDLTVRGVNARGSGIVVSGGGVWIENGASAQDITMSSGIMYISADPGTGKIDSGAAVSVKDLKVIGGTVKITSGGMVTDISVAAGATLNFAKDGGHATLQGGRTGFAEGTLYFGTTAIAGYAVNGVIYNLNAGTKEFQLSVGDDIVLEDAVLNHVSARVSCFDGASVDGATVSAGAIICNGSATGTMDNVTLVGAGIMNLSGTAKASNTVVKAGGQFAFHTSGASAENTTIMAGGKLVLKVAANTGNRLTLDFTGAGAGAETKIDQLRYIADSTTVFVTGAEQAVGTYYLGSGGALYDSASYGTLSGVTQKWGLYENALVNGGTYDDALNGVTYSFNGTALTTTELTIATGAAAGLSGDNYTALRTNDRAAKWTGAAADATLVTENFEGDAWLEVAGDLTGALYGAAVDFAHTVNVNAKSGTIRNLAAGAEAGKTVGAVKLTFDGADLAGAGYAGGFGSVTGKTETLINEGSFAKDFYAGALANYAKTGATTSAGDVTLTIEDGEFSGNIYGAASVKAGAATGLVHSVGNVTIDVKGGETKKGNQACLFAGGYATGSAASDSAVYTVNNIDVTISGGTWTSGDTAGGRGVFGGIFASQVTAVAEDVTLTITGGTFGNVYGGGWAQKNGVSVVDDVEITISGGTIANVFGGGTHSTSGGSTTVDDVSINISGGNITGAIYARGQADGDVVSGNEVSVTFTGDTNFGCGVFGYSYVGGAASKAVLSYTAYTGTFSGNIGGFDGIVFDDDTAMTLTTASADVSNGKWEFDFTDRAAELAGTSFLTWSGADFENDTIKVSFADETQAKAGWNIATVAEAFTGTSFDVEVGSTEITGLAYDTAISGTGTAYDGWGFGLESGVLKFKQLA